MGFEHCHPNPRVEHAVNRALDLRAAYLQDLLFQLMRLLGSWRRKSAPSAAAAHAELATASETGTPHIAIVIAATTAAEPAARHGAVRGWLAAPPLGHDNG